MLRFGINVMAAAPKRVILEESNQLADVLIHSLSVENEDLWPDDDSSRRLTDEAVLSR